MRQLGFAAGLFQHAPAPLKDSPRLALAGTALVMLGMTALAVAAYRWYRPEPPRLLVQEAVYNHPTLAAQTVRRIDPVGSTHYHVTLGSTRHLVSLLDVPAGADIPVIWRWQAVDNAVHLEGSDSVLLRAGRLAQPIRACGDTWPQRSLVVIAAPFADDQPAPRQLAIRLLDTGSADQVLLGIHWQQDPERMARPERITESRHASAGDPAGCDRRGERRSQTCQPSGTVGGDLEWGFRRVGARRRFPREQSGRSRVVAVTRASRRKVR